MHAQWIKRQLYATQQLPNVYSAAGPKKIIHLFAAIKVLVKQVANTSWRRLQQ